MSETPIPLLIKETSRIIRCGFDSLFDGRGIRPADGRILCAVIEDENLTSADIREMFGLSKATVSESLNSLASGGFIQYIPSSTSKREKRIMATDKGHECHEEIRRAIEAFDLKAVSGLMDQEISELERLLRVVAANVGEDKA